MKTLYTNITPVPSQIPRQLAIDVLHSHSEVITLNPLVLDHKPIRAPRDAPSDEFYSTWYEITERIQYVPGLGKMGSGKITFRGCFHDMPWGLQTHVYAPVGVDLRHKWQIKGSQPGEPAEPRELGSGAPAEGLYLREDVQIRCNMTMLSFVKKELKAASKIMVDRFVKKAELLDAGVLHGMFENGKLKTMNPADRSSVMVTNIPTSPNPYTSPSTIALPSPTQRYSSASGAPDMSAYSRQSYYGHAQPSVNSNGEGLAIELPGDSTFYPQQRKASSNNSQSNVNNHPRHSQLSEMSGNSPSQSDAIWSDNQSSRASVASRSESWVPSVADHFNGGVRPSNGTEYNSYGASELPTNDQSRSPIPPPKIPVTPPPASAPMPYRYNPQDFSGVRYG